MKKLLAAAALLASASGPAFAYTAYVSPNAYLPNVERVRFQASFAGTFFTPQYALGATFKVIQPDGTEGIFDQVEITANSTLLGTYCTLPGTYRITSGEQLGPVTTLVSDSNVAGGWRPLAPGETPAADGQTTTLQTATVADTYVTRGAPSRGSVDAPSGTLAIRPVTHPNQILVSQGLQVQALLNGQPYAETAVVLYAAGQADTDTTRYFVTDANGMATITLDQPGSYVIAIRYRGNAPAGSEAAVRSYTTTLTFEAMTALPPVVQVEAPRRPRHAHNNPFRP